MIVVDASAILAILLHEPDGEALKSALFASGGGVMSPVNHWEVLVRAKTAVGEEGRDLAEELISTLGIVTSPAGADDARRAADAFERFGKHTPAKLNLGDCFAYALAAKEGQGLLYKGEDFPRTDVVSALD